MERAGRLARYGAMVALATAISACSMGNMFGTGSANTAAIANASASPTEVAAAAPDALPAIATQCPPIKVRDGAETYARYAGGNSSDPRKLLFQAVIDQQSRNCVVSNGLITVKMGVVGRLMLGPAGNEKEVTVPLRFAVERNNVAMFTEKYNIPVAITPPAQAADFVKVVDNVQIPYLGGENIVIWVGFDPRG
jgi:hypothetical protein